jgi:hypothetical protein
VLQVVPFLRPLLEFVRQRGSAAVKARANEGLKALRNPTGNASLSTALLEGELARAGGTTGPTAATLGNGADKRKKARRAPPSVAGGVGGGGAGAGQPGVEMLPGLDKDSSSVNFEELLRLNEALVGKDGMPAYGGLPQARLAQRKAPFWSTARLQLPKIAFKRQAATGNAAAEWPHGSTSDGKRAHAWLTFQLDRSSIMSALGG